MKEHLYLWNRMKNFNIQQEFQRKAMENGREAIFEELRTEFAKLIKGLSSD